MEDISCLSNEQLSKRLRDLGVKHGPITTATRRVYEKRLLGHNANGDLVDGANVAEQQRSENNFEDNASSSTQQQPSSPDEVNANTTFYGVCIEDRDSDKDMKVTDELVFTSHKAAVEAMKSLPGARMKRFSTKSEAAEFSVSNSLKTCQNDSLNRTAEPTIPYKSPTPQQLVLFRTKIEEGNVAAVEKDIKENPKYLVSSFETPVILQEGSRYNAMHIAVRANQIEMCKLIIRILGDGDFWSLMFPNDGNKEANILRSKRLLGYYVNIPEKGAGDTPLHIACKFGFKEVVRLLVSLPYLEKARTNKFQETAEQVICSRSEGNDTVKKEIKDLLEEKVYIELLRAEDESKDPVLCFPLLTSSNGTSSANKLNRSSSPLEPRVQVKAFAGPMSPEQARHFYKEWRSPKAEFLNDFEKGKERRGRKLAASYGVPWKEYWSFLECSVNLSSNEGLKLLENYFRKKTVSRNMLRTTPFVNHLNNSNTSQSRGIQSTDLLAKSLMDDFNGKSNEANDIQGYASPPVVEKLDCLMAELSLYDEESPSGTSQIRGDDIAMPSGCVMRNSTDTNRSSTNSMPESDIMQISGLEDSQNALTVFEDSIVGGHEVCRTIYVSGDLPSKLDFDVFRALEGVNFDAKEYPLVSRWKKNICKYSAEERCRWPSPCAPRYRSRVAKMSSFDS